jgi:hypothetical protein
LESVKESLIEISDVELIERMGIGDSEAFSVFHHRHIGIIYSTAYRVLNNETDAEDVAQEVMFMLWEKSPMYDTSRGKPVVCILKKTSLVFHVINCKIETRDVGKGFG